jgi:hypothetical protein
MEAQSAMEYLTTYFWAFLIIAIILVFLYKLGVFGGNSQVRLPPNGCFVYRPAGPNTTSNLGLEGDCNGDLPEFVVQFTGAGGNPFNLNCNGAGTCILAPPPFPSYDCVSNMTISAWSFDTGMGSAGAYTPATGWTQGSGAVPPVPALGGVYSVYNTLGEGTVGIEYNDTMIRYEARNSLNRDQVVIVPSVSMEGRWINTVISMTNGVATGYLNGTQVTTPSPNIGCQVMIGGSIGDWDRGFNGFISNIQVYDTGLGANQIQQIYRNGLGGAPVDLTHITAWWMLNGNPNDSASDGYGGTANQILYESGYTPPP